MNENNFLYSSLFTDARAQIAVMMDKATENHVNLFGETWYEKHFTRSQYPRTENEFTAILEEIHAVPAASTINEYSERPIRSFDGFGKVKAEMMHIAHTYKLEAEDLQAISDAQRRLQNAQLLDYVVNRLLNIRDKAVRGIYARQDLVLISAISNKGKYTFTEENDPGSPFIGQTIAFGFDESHAATANTPWTDANKDTVNILEDIMAIYQAAEIKPTKMLMSTDVLFYMLSTAKIKLYVNGTDNASRPISVTDLNTLFAQYGLPSIELVQREIRVDSNGGKSSKIITPWNKNTILFAPDNHFGTIERKITDAEDGRRSPGVEYAYYNGIEVANYTQGLREGTNYTEFVTAGLTYAPVISAIPNMWSLDIQRA